MGGNNMRVSGVITNSVVNGIGVRDVLFTQGCTHRCKGCHNPSTWDVNGGVEIPIDLLVRQFKSDNNITISGGEPLLQTNDILEFMKEIRKTSDKTFWVYTGFRYEDIPHYVLNLLSEYVDVLVDGAYEEDKKNLSLPFRGSSNQRLINLPKSLERGEVVLENIE